MSRLALLLIMGVALFGCGQKGPLTLPTAPHAAPQNQALPAASPRNEQRQDNPHGNNAAKRADADKNTKNSAQVSAASNIDQQKAVIHPVASAAQEG
jgi:predicted small lipoprotein YifL